MIDSENLSGIENLENVLGLLADEHRKFVIVKIEVEDILHSAVLLELRHNETCLLRIRNTFEIRNDASSEREKFLALWGADFSDFEMTVASVDVRVNDFGFGR